MKTPGVLSSRNFLAELQRFHRADLNPFDIADGRCNLVQIFLDDREGVAVNPLKVSQYTGDIFPGLFE